MFTRYANMTVGQSFGDLGLTEAISGLASNNPNLLSLNLVDARKAVVEEIGRHGIMMVLDNHVSKPMWCCGDHDGNSFFGSVYFDPDEWLQGLAIVANIFKDTPMVVGMSLRNELRGPLQNVDVWYKYVEKGAKTINSANPNLLVIISGLSYDLDFRFLKQRPLKLKTMKKKVVYETHRYAFTEGQSKAWVAGPLNKVCHDITREMEEKEGFLVRGGNPLFVSEFGINQMGNSEADNRHLPCLLSYLADLDLDWSVWALQGSYYLRDRHHGPDETYGMFTANWTALRNPNFLSKLQFLQQKFQVVGEDLPLTLSTICNNDGQSNNTWSLASNSMFQLANRGDNGLVLCLDFDSSYSSSTILTRKCVGLEEGDMKNPQTQWFKLIASNTK
nr:glycosyl hydrolase 5 family protein-like isoform X1 [Ipomoea batatas]